MTKELMALLEEIIESVDNGKTNEAMLCADYYNRIKEALEKEYGY